MLCIACAKSCRRGEWWRNQAAVILIACLPPGYGSEIEPRKNVAVENSMQLHCVDSLRDRE